MFENPSIAALMNQNCINIKIDREEHPDLDELYMVARQLLTQQGGWPNTLFLTPDLKPFYAGGTFAPDESYGKMSFPRLLEWLNFSWTTQESEVRKVADKVTEDMRPFLVHIPTSPSPLVGEGRGEGAFSTNSIEPAESSPSPNLSHRGRGEEQKLYQSLAQFHDPRAGGFFQAPKFPHESYLQFLLAYYEATDTTQALDIVTHSLRKMAAGGIYDQVGCGFHRYAVDKEWYVPHFEKMLYNQAQLARVYTDAARLTASPYLADIAKSILDFTGGPLTSGTGAFYSAIDAETDGIEGAYYAWTADEFKVLLTPQEITILTTFYALADIPHFPGHKKVEGQALILRKPLDEAARERQIPYLELAAICGQLMNKLLTARNKRPSPRLDDKVIVSWNGLMIDAFAHAGKVFNHKPYIARARNAVDFLLENAIDNNGALHHIYADNRPQLPAILEDYAYLIKGILTLHKAKPDDALLDAAISLTTRVEELFADATPGYFASVAADDILIRSKNPDDSATPNANAIMAHNLIDLHAITKEHSYRDRAQNLIDFFLTGSDKVQPEHATMIHAALRLNKQMAPSSEHFDNPNYTLEKKTAPGDTVTATATLFPADAKPGSACELLITLDIKDGWHINAMRSLQPFLIPTQIDVQGVELIKLSAPEPLHQPGQGDNETLLVYAGLVTFTAHIKLPQERGKIKAQLRYQACNESNCYAPKDLVLTL